MQFETWKKKKLMVSTQKYWCRPYLLSIVLQFYKVIIFPLNNIIWLQSWCWKLMIKTIFYTKLIKSSAIKFVIIVIFNFWNNKTFFCWTLLQNLQKVRSVSSLYAINKTYLYIDKEVSYPHCIVSNRSR